MTDLPLICKNLLFDEPFYGMLLLNLNKEASKKIPTACVGIEGVMYKISINPDFWDSLSNDHKKGLILHEVRHIAFFHLTDFKHLVDRELANIAMDIFINQDIDKRYLPEGGCNLDSFPEIKLEKGLGTNEYYKLLQQNKQDGSSKSLNDLLEAMGKGEDSSTNSKGDKVNNPNHKWEEVENASEAAKKIIERNMLKIISETVEQVKKDRGTIPGGMEELLERMMQLEPAKFNWRSYLKRFVGTSTKSWTNKTKRKTSDRFEDAPGQREFEFSHIMVAVDTSGSVSTAELKEFFNEIAHMHKTGHDITVVLADTQINKVFKYNPRMDIEIVGRGGTDFQPAYEMYRNNLRKYSCLIYVTDGEAPSPKGNQAPNVLWVMSSISHLNDELPGKCIKLN